MSKQYGLIDPKANKPATGLAKHAAFDSESDSDPADGKKSVSLELGESQKRQARAAQKKAMEEDPTVYQYDELYDEMDSKRKEAKSDKSKEERKPKYIGKLLETAEKRKKEQERRIERQVQKEREAEGEKFKDKESFVTSAYRAKLEEIKKAEEEEKREEYLESIGDVTKQGDLGGFYRHIYSQKVGESSQPKKPDIPDSKQKVDVDEGSKNKSSEEHSESENDEERARKEALKSKEAGSAKSRRYRKRHSDDEAPNEEERNDTSKKVHLQSNLDADSDFSIDSNSSSSGDSGSESEEGDQKKKKPVGEKNESSRAGDRSSPEKKSKLGDEAKQSANGFESNDNNAKNVNGGDASGIDSKSKPEKPVEKKKEPKIDIWKKRTVGAAFDAAVQRYYERKAARESG